MIEDIDMLHRRIDEARERLPNRAALLEETEDTRE